ncbi:MAG TPA: hypothetical protein VHL34_23630 [Rhizomicrobium sp.]|nr:hypothetical protein [Rhizomicrobium sp.]
MLPKTAFQRAVTVGVMILVTFVILSHYLPLLSRNVLFATIMIAGVAGLLYAREVARGYGIGALGGAFAGGICALIGIALAILLGDASAYTLGPVPEMVLLIGTATSVLTGAIGGLFGQWDAVRNGRA